MLTIRNPHTDETYTMDADCNLIEQQVADTKIVFSGFESHYTMSKNTFNSLTSQDITDMNEYILSVNPCNKSMKVIDKDTNEVLYPVQVVEEFDCNKTIKSSNKSVNISTNNKFELGMLFGMFMRGY